MCAGQIEVVMEQGQDIVTFGLHLEQYLTEPLRLNTASKDELNELRLLTARQIKNLLAYLRESGPLIHLAELQVIEAFELPDIHRISPYVVVETPQITPNNKAQIEGKLMMQSTGLHNWTDSGRQGIYLNQIRAQLDFEHLRLSIAKRPIGIDPHGLNLTASWQINRINLIAGRYRIRAGLGISLWQAPNFDDLTSGFSFKLGKTIQPYTGWSTYGNLQGVAVMFDQGLYEWSTFMAYRNDGYQLQDGHWLTIDSDSGTLGKTISLGTSCKKQLNHGRIGGQFNLQITPFPRIEPQHIAHVFRPNQRAAQSASLFGRHEFSNIVLQWEIAETANFKIGAAVRANVDLSRNLAIGARIRLSQIGFIPSLSSDQNFGEYRIYPRSVQHHITWTVPKQIDVQAMHSFEHYPWSRYNHLGPSTQQTWSIRTTKQMGKQSKLTLRFKRKIKSISSVIADPPLAQVSNQTTTQMGIGVRTELSDKIELQARLEQKRTLKNSTDHKGHLLYAQGRFSLSAHTTITSRITRVLVTDYSTAIWVFENSLPYAWNAAGNYGDHLITQVLLKHQWDTGWAIQIALKVDGEKQRIGFNQHKSYVTTKFGLHAQYKW